MDPKRWSKPVTFEENARGNYRTIVSTKEASRILLPKWPTGSGREYRRAQKICTDVLEGKKPPSEARRAFLDAAKEARIPIREH